jgi:GDP/UDP-N,N'-diacetylbacillosamine 2-epimerase (hydrolysing)
VLGNSSSGLTEVPSFKKGTINVGDRQLGRLRAESVIDCEPSQAEIKHALDVLYSLDFQHKLSTVTNPYGDGGASNKVLEVIRDKDLSDLVKKRFNRLETK